MVPSMHRLLLGKERNNQSNSDFQKKIEFIFKFMDDSSLKTYM